MLALQGTIAITVRNGRRGQFCTGKIHTDVGIFSTTGAMLDEYPEGRYAGSFFVSRIYPNSYVIPAKGITISEVVADLHAMQLDDIDDVNSHDAVDSVVPIEVDETVPKTVVEPPVDVGPEKVDSIDSDGDASELFGILWPLGNSVKLDPTVERGHLAQQAKWLGLNGYAFNIQTQTWHKQ